MKGYERVSTSMEGEKLNDSPDTLVGCELLLLIVVISSTTALLFAVFLIFNISSFYETSANSAESARLNSILFSVLAALNQSNSFHDTNSLIFSHIDQISQTETDALMEIQGLSKSIKHEGELIQSIVSEDKKLEDRIENIDLNIDRIAMQKQENVKAKNMPKNRVVSETAEDFSMDWLPRPETFTVWPTDHEAWDPANVSDGGPHDKGVTYGMMNSGTHFTNSMVNLNCAPAQMKYTQHTFKHGHWFPRFVQTVSKRQPFIVTVKDPLTWMKSMCKTSHEIKCAKKVGTCSEKVFLPWRYRGKIYSNLAEIWQEYFELALYEHLHGSHKLMFMRYEDLLEEPDETIGRVCKHLGRKISKKSVQIRQRKSGFSSLGFKDQLEKYTNPGYRYANWTRHDLAELKKLIEPRLLEYFGYQFDDSIKYFPHHDH